MHIGGAGVEGVGEPDGDTDRGAFCRGDANGAVHGRVFQQGPDVGVQQLRGTFRVGFHIL